MDGLASARRAHVHEFLRQRTGLVLGLACVLFVACSGDATLSSDIATPASTTMVATEQLESTDTPTASPTATPSITPTPTPRPPTPPASAWQISDDFLFDNSQHPDCQLPCWQGLRVGVSDTDDIQNMFDTAFGFGGTYEFFPEGVKGKTIPGFFSAGNSWIFENDDAIESRFLTVITWIDDETYKYQGTRFSWADPRFDIYLKPQRVIEQLGQPSSALTNITLTEAVGTAVVKLMLIYDEGIAFNYTIWAPVTRSGSTSEEYLTLELCLGSELWLNEEYYAGFRRSAYIMEPLANGIEKLNSLQQNFIGIELDAYDYSDLQEAFDITLDELYDIALQPGDSCLYMNIR